MGMMVHREGKVEREGNRVTEKSKILVFLHCIQVVQLSVMHLNSYTQTFKLANQEAIFEVIS